MVGAVGEIASVKRRKLWKTGEDGLVPAMPSKLGRVPHHCYTNGVKPPLFFIVSLCCRLPPQNGGNGQGL